jgi:hypothetical protein
MHQCVLAQTTGDDAKGDLSLANVLNYSTVAALNIEPR